MQLLELTPFARTEFELGWDPTNDPVERARRLIIRSFMGFGSNAHSDMGRGHKTTGFRASSSRSGTTPAADWANYPGLLPDIIGRMRGVIIERRPAVQVMQTHDDPRGAATMSTRLTCRRRATAPTRTIPSISTATN